MIYKALLITAALSGWGMYFLQVATVRINDAQFGQPMSAPVKVCEWNQLTQEAHCHADPAR